MRVCVCKGGSFSLSTISFIIHSFCYKRRCVILVKVAVFVFLVLYLGLSILLIPFTNGLTSQLLLRPKYCAVKTICFLTVCCPVEWRYPVPEWCESMVSSAVNLILVNRTVWSYKFQLHFLYFYAHVSLKCPCYCVTLLSVSALHLGAWYLHEIFIFWNVHDSFDKKLVTIDKIWYVFCFFGGEGLLGSYLFLSRIQTVELNQV